MGQQQSERQIPTLDGWRALAISGVLFSHSSMELRTGGEALAYRAGDAGVSLFFAISGFLITTLLLREYSENGGIALSRFYLRRIFRILPAAFTYLLIISIAGYLALLPLKRGEVLASMLFANNYWPHRSWFTAHFWSLSIEEHFYLIWPFILSRVSAQGAAWTAGAGILASIVWRPIGFTMNWGVEPLHRTDMRLDAFMCAGLIAVVLHQGLYTKFFEYKWTGVLAALLLLTIYVVGRGAPGFRNAKMAGESWLMPIIVVSAVCRPSSLFSTWLQRRLPRTIGRMSYSLYLWQQLFLSALLPGGIVLKFAGLFTCAWLSLVLVEDPCRRLVRRWTEARKEVLSRTKLATCPAGEFSFRSELPDLQCSREDPGAP